MSSKNVCHVFPDHQIAFRELGLDIDTIFSHSQIQPWRTLYGDRDNSVLNATLSNGIVIRWHVKRYVAAAPAEEEVAGHNLLLEGRIATAPLVAWGVHSDGRSFVISEDLAHHQPADKMIDCSERFDAMLNSTADLAAKLHAASLHHRDLYLCHFFVNEQQPADVKLIDVARVASFAKRLLKKRWIVKDLAQFWYSTMSLPISDTQRDAWLSRYAAQRGIDPNTVRPAIIRKSNWIARHDRKLKLSQPTRNVSIDTPVPSPRNPVREG